MPSKPATPKIVNIDEVKMPLAANTLIHYTDAQWAKATKGIETSRSVPQGTPVLIATPLRSGGVLVEVGCPAKPGSICKPSWEGDTAMSHGRCDCGPGDIGPFTPLKPSCGPAIRLKGGRIACKKGNCRGTCEVRRVAGMQDKFYCTCVPASTGGGGSPIDR